MKQFVVFFALFVAVAYASPLERDERDIKDIVGTGVDATHGQFSDQLAKLIDYLNTTRWDLKNLKHELQAKKEMDKWTKGQEVTKRGLRIVVWLLEKIHAEVIDAKENGALEKAKQYFTDKVNWLITKALGLISGKKEVLDKDLEQQEAELIKKSPSFRALVALDLEN